MTSVAFSSDGNAVVTGSGDKTAKVWDAQTGKPELDDKGWHAEELEYRLIHAQPNYWRYQEGYAVAREANDLFEAQFYLDRLLSLPQQRTTQQYQERNRLQANPTLIARTSFHTPAVSDPYDREIVHFLAADADRLAQRIVAQECIRDGKPEKAVPLLHYCLIRRPQNAPPVEELLIASAFLKMNRLEDAKNYYRSAANWLDRPRDPMRAANVVTHAINPWNALGEMFKPLDDPRHNTFDWESWHECEVFRAEVESRLAGKP